MEQDIVNYVRHCETSQMNKLTQMEIKLPFPITNTPEFFAKLQFGHSWTSNTDIRNQFLLTDISRRALEIQSNRCYTAARYCDSGKMFCRRNCSEIWDTPAAKN